jgi:hypothetical protein
VPVARLARRSAFSVEPPREIHQLDLVLDANVRDRYLDGALLISQRDDRIDAHGTARGEVAGRERYGHKENADGSEG